MNIRSVLLSTMALALAGATAPVCAQFKVTSTFAGNTQPGWTFGTTNNVGNNDSGILTGGYGLIADGNNTNDPIGGGFFRLTTDLGTQSGSARYTGGSIPSTQGVIVYFDYVIWSGTGADGISFYLYDATQNMAGAINGAGLGYCWGAGGYLGVGLDEFGNFSANSTGATWCNSAGPGVAADRVVVRGPLANNNIYIGGAAAPGGIDVPSVSVRPGIDRARVALLPNGSGGYRVSVALSQNGGALTPVLTNLNFPYAAPANLRMGFGGSTGGSNNIHEIRNIIASVPADLVVTKTVNAATFPRGGTPIYSITVTNADINVIDPGNQAPSINAANAPDISDAFPAALTGVSWTCSATAGSTCPAASGVGNIAVTGGYTLAPGGVLTFTATGTVSNSATCNGTVANTVTADFSAADGFGDTDTTNNTATANFSVACTDLSITKTNTPGVNGNVDQAADAVTSGASSNYSITVTNGGPLAADGATVTDPVPTNLTCTTASCGSVTGGAVCPAATGAALLAALQAPAGVAIPTLPANSSVTFTLACTVP